jgi:hypothetical protein
MKRASRIEHQSHRSRDRMKLVRMIRSASCSVVAEMAPIWTTASIASAWRSSCSNRSSGSQKSAIGCLARFFHLARSAVSMRSQTTTS